MGEINEALGIGEAFTIDGKDYRIRLATYEDMETIDDKIQGLYLTEEGIRINFIKLSDEEDNKPRDERKKKLLALLQLIFPEAPVASLKKMNRKEMAKAIDYFLLS